ncbi:MAG: peptidylprolyl isomerase [Planctomycetota bacterium]
MLILPRTPRWSHLGPAIPAAFALVNVLIGCTSQPDPAADTPRRASQPGPSAIVENRSLNRDDLFPRLAEAAGAAVLNEFVLESALADELRLLNLTVTDELVQQERGLVERAIDAGAGSGGADAIRARRGLGPLRLDRAVWRNAALRLLARDRGVAEPTETDLRGVFEERFGDAVRVRLIVVPTERAAAAIATEIGRATGPSTAKIDVAARLATEHSIDPSAARGGLYERLPLESERYPSALRSAARITPPGRVAPVIALDSAFAVLLVESALPAAQTSFEEQRDALAAELRDAAEQRAMDRLAQRLTAGVTTFVRDPALLWSWENRP